MHTTLDTELQALGGMDGVARDLLIEASRGKPRHVGARCDLPEVTDGKGAVGLVLRGWICTFRHLADGRWQIVSFYLAGDYFRISPDSNAMGETSLRTMMDCIVCQVSADTYARAAERHPALARALRRSDALQAASLQEGLVSLGRRTARERCAHLVCELFWRLRAAEQTKGSTIDFPLTQEEVGGTIGVSTVHANRVLQDLRGAGLIEQSGKKLTVLDLPGLERVALFDPRCLRLRHESRLPESLVEVARSSAVPDRPRPSRDTLAGLLRTTFVDDLRP